MSREKLREAIDLIEKSIDNLGPVLDYAAAKQVLAAAKAWTCNRCGGEGRICTGADFGKFHTYSPCPACKEWREAAGLEINRRHS